MPEVVPWNAHCPRRFMLLLVLVPGQSPSFREVLSRVSGPERKFVKSMGIWLQACHMQRHLCLYRTAHPSVLDCCNQRDRLCALSISSEAIIEFQLLSGAFLRPA